MIYKITETKNEYNQWTKSISTITEAEVPARDKKGLWMFNILGDIFIADYAFVDPADNLIYLRDVKGNTAYIYNGRIQWCFDTVYSNALLRYRRSIHMPEDD